MIYVLSCVTFVALTATAVFAQDTPSCIEAGFMVNNTLDECNGYCADKGGNLGGSTFRTGPTDDDPFIYGQYICNCNDGTSCLDKIAEEDTSIPIDNLSGDCVAFGITAGSVESTCMSSCSSRMGEDVELYQNLDESVLSGTIVTRTISCNCTDGNGCLQSTDVLDTSAAVPTCTSKSITTSDECLNFCKLSIDAAGHSAELTGEVATKCSCGKSGSLVLVCEGVDSTSASIITTPTLLTFFVATILSAFAFAMV